MKFEESFGVIPLQKIENEWCVLLIKHKHGGFWAFPKGHAEKGESALDTAKRELFEETGLGIRQILFESPLVEDYEFYRRDLQVRKKVTYYVAEVEGEVRLQAEEVYDSCWVKLEEAEAHVTFPEAKAICHQVKALLERPA